MKKVGRILIVGLFIFSSCGESKKPKEESKKTVQTSNKMTFDKLVELIEASVLDINNEKLSFDNRKSDTVVVDFWATWCPPCVREINRIVSDDFSLPSNIQFIGLSTDQKLEDWEQFTNTKNLPWDQYHVKQAEIQNILHIEYIPYKILLNFSDKTFINDYELKLDSVQQSH